MVKCFYKPLVKVSPLRSPWPWFLYWCMEINRFKLWSWCMLTQQWEDWFIALILVSFSMYPSRFLDFEVVLCSIKNEHQLHMGFVPNLFMPHTLKLCYQCCIVKDRWIMLCSQPPTRTWCSLVLILLSDSANHLL